MTKTLLYIDHFDPSNSNYYWYDAFKRKVDKIFTMECTNPGLVNVNNLTTFIKKNQVTHIHLGGSAKLNCYVSLLTLKSLLTTFPNLYTSAHYGDVYRNHYNHDRGAFFNATHCTNRTECVHPNMYFFPHCVEETWLTGLAKTPSKQFDFAFSGNNYSSARRVFLQKIIASFPDKKFVLVGADWSSLKAANVTLVGKTTTQESLSWYQKALLVLDDPVDTHCCLSLITRGCEKGHTKEYQGMLCHNEKCPSYTSTDGYFSSRPLHAMLSGTPILCAPRKGMDSVIKNVFFFPSREIGDIVTYIKTLLSNPTLLEETGLLAREEVKKYSFDKAVDRLLGMIP